MTTIRRTSSITASGLLRRRRSIVDVSRIIAHRLIRRLRGDRPIRLTAFLTQRSPSTQSTLLSAILAPDQSSTSTLDIVERIALRLPMREFFSALTAGRPELTRVRIDRLTQSVCHSLAVVEYARAMLDRRFRDAYAIWEIVPEREPCLEALSTPPDDDLVRSMAVVLPGPVDNPYGQEIDSHDLVARTGFTIPGDTESIGARCDITFVNWNRLGELAMARSRFDIHANRIVADRHGRRLSMPAWLQIPVEFDLMRIDTPLSPRTYMPLRIVPWCHERGIRPTLYCADFYLGSSSYQSADYDSKRLLLDADDHVVSYLRHDVFFNHAALRHWYQRGVIRARGRLAELLDLDGIAFADALERRWRVT